MTVPHVDIFLLSTKWRESSEDRRESGTSGVLAPSLWTRGHVPWDKVRHPRIIKGRRKWGLEKV